jgi:hypothetical protein
MDVTYILFEDILLIEFEARWKNGLNKIRYRGVEEKTWNYLDVDIETLNLLVKHFGIISTCSMYNGQRIKCIDNLTTSTEIQMKYCDAEIKLQCKNKDKFYLPILEQQY